MIWSVVIIVAALAFWIVMDVWWKVHIERRVARLERKKL